MKVSVPGYQYNNVLPVEQDKDKTFRFLLTPCQLFLGRGWPVDSGHGGLWAKICPFLLNLSPSWILGGEGLVIP